MQTSCRGNFLGKNINKIKSLYMIHLICLLYYKSGQFRGKNNSVIACKYTLKGDPKNCGKKNLVVMSMNKK